MLDRWVDALKRDVKRHCAALAGAWSTPISSACNSNEALKMKMIKARLSQFKSFAVKKFEEFDAYIDRGIASWQSEYSLAMAAY